MPTRHALPSAATAFTASDIVDFLVRFPRLVAAVASLSGMLGCAATSPARDAHRERTCTEIQGLPYVALSFDGGKTLVESRAPRVPGTKLQALLALDVQDQLLAAVGGELFASQDAGCHWKAVGETHADFFAVGKGGVAYGSAYYGRGSHAFEVLNLERVKQLPEPPGIIVSLAADPKDSSHLRIMTARGEVFDSTDQGGSWRPRSGIERHLATIAPDDLDAMVALVDVANGRRLPFASRDGGRSWVRSRLNATESGSWWLVAPVVRAGDVVWLISSRRIYRSDNGGVTFTTALPNHSLTIPGNELGATQELVVRGESGSDLLVLGDDNSVWRLQVQGTESTWTKQPVPVSGAHTELTAATSIPGRPSMLCFAVTTTPPDLDVTF